MVSGFPILLLVFGLLFCFDAANAAPLQRSKQIFPTRENAPNSEFDGFFVEPSGDPEGNGEIQNPTPVDTREGDNVPPSTTEGGAAKPIRTIGVLPPADPNAFSLSVTGTAHEQFTATAISTTSFEAPPFDDIQPTPTEAPAGSEPSPFENNPPAPTEASNNQPTPTEVSSAFEQRPFDSIQPTPVQTSAALDLPPFNVDTQPPPTETSAGGQKADEVLTQSPAEPTATVPPIDPVLTQVASYSPAPQPSPTFILSGVPTPATVVGEGTVKGTVATNLANAPTGMVSEKPTSTVPVIVKPQITQNSSSDGQSKKEQAASPILAFINSIGQMLARLDSGKN